MVSVALLVNTSICLGRGRHDKVDVGASGSLRDQTRSVNSPFAAGGAGLPRGRGRTARFEIPGGARASAESADRVRAAVPDRVDTMA